MSKRFHRGGRTVVIPLVLFMALTMGCSAADFVQRNLPTPTVPPTRESAPTFTPTPDDIQQVVIVTPPNAGTPGVIIIPPGMDPKDVIPVPTATPIPPATAEQAPTGTDGQVSSTGPATAVPTVTETPTATSTFTPEPTATATATATPTPFILADGALVNLRVGPSESFPLVAQLGPDIPVAVIGINPEGTWLQICCVSGDSVWVSRDGIVVTNDISGVPLQDAGPTPSPTPTGTPTMTPTPTATPTATHSFPLIEPSVPSSFSTNNEFLTIWSKMFVQPDQQFEADPAAGYYLQVLFNGFERPPTNDKQPSADTFFLSAPRGAGNSVEYNYKYEYTPPDPKTIDCNSLQPEFSTRCANGTLTHADLIGTGPWTIFVVDGAGNQLSEEVEFTTSPNNLNREIYIGWNRVR